MPLTDAQLAMRKTRISATDAGVILGQNPWKTQADLWLEKTQDLAPLENDAMELGNKLESPLIDWCAESLGVLPDRELGTIVHPKFDWLCATPDAGIVGQRRGIEAKTAGIKRGWIEDADAWGDCDSSQVPEHYWIQCQVQMSCCQWDAVWLSALVGGKGWVRYFIPRNSDAIEGIIDVCQEWHERCIVGGERPPDGSLPHLDVLKRVRRVPNKVARVPDEVAAACLEAHRSLKAAEELYDAAKAAVLYCGPDCDGFESDAGRFTNMVQSRRGLDMEKLRAEFPEVAEACAKVSTFPVFRIKKSKGGIA